MFRTISSASNNVPGCFTTSWFSIRLRCGFAASSAALRILHIDQTRVVVHLAIVEMFVGPFVVPILDRVFLPERVPGPILGQQNPPKIRMAVKLNPEKIKDLSLHPVRTRPDRSHARTRLTIGQRN